MAGDWRAKTWEQQFVRDAWDDVPTDEDARVQVVLDRHPLGLDQRRVGILMGVSKQRVEQIERRARAKIRARYPRLADMIHQADEAPRMRRRAGSWVQAGHLRVEHHEGVDWGTLTDTGKVPA